MNVSHLEILGCQLESIVVLGVAYVAARHLALHGPNVEQNGHFLKGQSRDGCMEKKTLIGYSWLKQTFGGKKRIKDFLRNA